MNELLTTIGIATIALLAGGGIGFWFAERRAKAQAAKTEDVQQRFDDYRRQVTDHFGRTAEHFQAIGEQYRELYEHMASGAESLFDPPEPGSRLESAARMALGDAADRADDDRSPSGDAEAGEQTAGDAVASGEETLPNDAGDESGPSPDSPQKAKIQDDDSVAERADDADTSAAADTADSAADDTPRTYH